jgi:hypothetical protein
LDCTERIITDTAPNLTDQRNGDRRGVDGRGVENEQDVTRNAAAAARGASGETQTIEGGRDIRRGKRRLLLIEEILKNGERRCVARGSLFDWYECFLKQNEDGA